MFYKLGKTFKLTYIGLQKELKRKHNGRSIIQRVYDTFAKWEMTLTRWLERAKWEVVFYI